jgi:hypothetical protein
MRNVKQIQAYLNEVASVLKQLGVNRSFHMVLTGGAYMIIQKQRAFTEDIDFATIQVPNPIPTQGAFQVTVIHDEVARSGSRIPFAQEMREAIEIVAQRHPKQLAEDWLNDQAAEYLYDDAPNPDVQLWQVFGNLVYVYLPAPQYILAIKLAASRLKDTNDITLLMKTLKITHRDQVQVILDQYLLPEAQEFWEVGDKLDDLFA